MNGSDRPFGRKIVRLCFQLLGRERAHRQDIWPGITIDRDGAQVLWRGKPLFAISKTADILPHGLPLIAVVGSGPSFRDQQIEALGDGTAILCNGAALLADRIRPLAVAVEDERFVFRHHAMLTALSHDIPLLLSPSAIRAWAERAPASLRDRKIALINNLEKPVERVRRKLSDPALRDVVIRSATGALSINPDMGVVITGTVAFSGLQFALAAAPRKIVLAGVDLTNDAQPRFYETADRAPSGLSAGLDRILGGFALARQIAERRGIAISCASPVSALLTIGYQADPLPVGSVTPASA